MDHSVVLSSSARRDLEDIVRYISLDAPQRALEFGQLLIEQARGLSAFPERGRIVPEIGDASIRELIVRSYRIVYRVNQERRRIEVLRFWHAARGVPQWPSAQ